MTATGDEYPCRILDFADRIYHVDCKDVKLSVGNGRNARLGSHLGAIHIHQVLPGHILLVVEILYELDAMPLGDSYIAIFGHWEVTQAGPDGKPTIAQVRTTEVIAKSGSGWHYVIDHASVGVPPPQAAEKHAPKGEQKK